jgi:DNA-binding transcriptional LysR family regulator
MRGEVGHLRLGFTVIAFYGHLPEAVRSYRNRFPDVRIELVEMNSPGLERSLELGEIDLAILHPPVGSSRLSLRMMPSQKMVLALPADHHLSRRRTISVRDLADEPFLIAPRTVGPSIYDRVIALFQQQGISPNIVQHVTPMTTLIGLVAAGVGVGLVTEGLARTGRPGVTFRDVSPTPPDLPMAAAWFGSSPSPTAQRFLELVTEMFTTRQDGVEGNLSGDGCD